MESEVIEIRFKKKISGSFLSQALFITMNRYPYFNTKLIEKDGDFYIVQKENQLVVRNTKKLAKLDHISCGYHLIDITYNNYSIFVSFHHTLCDGRGIKPFIETLIYYYCGLKYNSNSSHKGIRLAEDKLLEGETLDPFMEEFPSLTRDAYSIPENVPVEELTNYRFEIKIPH